MEVARNRPLDMLQAVWGRRKWLAILAFAVPIAAGVPLITFLPDLYRSSATVIVDNQQVPESFVRSTVTSAVEIRLNAISQEVLSRARLGKLIESLGLYAEQRKHASLEAVIGSMRRDIKLEVKNAQLKGLREATVAFTISYQGSDPVTVARVTNTLASFYAEENVRARERQASGTAEFLKVQLGETKKRLDELEQRVSGFKRRHLGELPQQMDANLVTLDRLNAQLRQNTDSQTRATERRQTLSSQLAEAESLMAFSPSGVSSAAGGAAGPPELRLAQRKEDLARLRTQFSERYPDVVQLAAEVAALEREIAAAKARAAKSETNPATGGTPSPAPSTGPVSPYTLRLKEALSDVQTELKILKTEEGRLREGIAAYQARVENVPKREQEFMELSRDYDSTRELYRSLLKRYEEAQLAESMEQRQKGEQFRILDQAMPSSQPAAPNRLRLLLVTLASAVGLAVAAAVLAEHLDTSFHHVDQLRAFSNVPVLVSIPRIVTQTDLRRGWWRMRLAATAALVGLLMIVGLAYVAAKGNEGLVLLLARVAS